MIDARRPLPGEERPFRSPGAIDARAPSGHYTFISVSKRPIQPPPPAFGYPGAAIPPAHNAAAGKPLRTLTTVKGLPVSGGIVIGRVLVIDDAMRRVVRRTIKPEEVKSELARLESAVKASIGDIQRVHEQAERDMGKDKYMKGSNRILECLHFQHVSLLRNWP